jgi:hypothetical protein
LLAKCRLVVAKHHGHIIKTVKLEELAEAIWVHANLTTFYAVVPGGRISFKTGRHVSEVFHSPVTLE